MKAVQETIGASEPYMCGGTPRDRLLGHLENIADLDITTGDKSIQYLFQEFSERLGKKFNIHSQTFDDGHSAIQLGKFKMDFSSNFNVPDIEKILMQMGVKDINEMKKEMFSRDFTCNALLLSFDMRRVLDPTGRGTKDCQDKIIKTCLAPQITLTTNKNRVVRAIYLASKLGFDIDKSIVEFVQKNPQTVKISTEKAMAEKLNKAFEKDADRASHYLSLMGLWDLVPVTELMQPYYLKRSSMTTKKAYFQGGGGVNEPTPGKKKYKSDPAIVVQPRFKEPFYRNYDLYNVPGEHGPGAGWHDMEKYKSVEEFLKAKRKKLKDKYKADDSWIEDSGEITKKNPNVKKRASILARLVKLAEDENDGPNYDYGSGMYMNMDEYDSVEDFRKNKPKGQGAFYADDNAIDFPIDDQIDSSEIGQGGPFGLGMPLPEDDFEGKAPSTLDFGRDYVEDEEPMDEDLLEMLMDKYYDHKSSDLFGQPDGVDHLEEEDMMIDQNNPEYGTRGPESLIYEDKWNI